MTTFWFRNHADKEWPYVDTFLPQGFPIPDNYMIVGPDLWNCNSQEALDLYADGFLNTHHLDNEINPIGYLDYFLFICPEKKIDCSKMEYLKIEYVDRGVWFKPFGRMLKHLFPNLKTLEFQQNWSYNPTGDKYTDYAEFLDMLKLLQLNNFYLDDSQSTCFSILKADDIFNSMPENSVFVLKSDYGDNFGLKKDTSVDPEWYECHSYEKYYWKRGTKEFYAYKRI